MRSLLFACLALAPLAAFGQVVYTNDFESPVGPEWSSTTLATLDLKAGGSRSVLGLFSNDTVTLTLSGFTPGQAATLAFDFYALDSWDGNSVSGPDVFRTAVDGTDVLNATFSNIDEAPYNYPQTYSPATPLGGAAGTTFPNYTGADERDDIANHDFYGSARYNFGGGVNPLFTFTPAASTVVFTFQGVGLEGIGNEEWALDNVRVTQAVPEPASVAALGLGAVALLRRRARR